VQDYFTPQQAGAPRTVPAAPLTAVPPAAPRRGRRALAAALLLLAAAATAGAAAAGRSAELPELRQVLEPAGATAGWGPSWVDDRGRPGRWDPCTPIGFVVNPTWAPHSGRADLAEALRRLSSLTGLRFADEGDTDELPSRGRQAYQPDRYGDRWAPLLVAWAPSTSTDVGIGGGTKGVALTVAVPGAAGPSLLTAQVVLDAEHRLASGFGPGSTEGEVLLHELAHAVGLGHVEDPTQVMYYRTTNSESEFGAGDRAGLAALGAAAGCLPAPRPAPLSPPA
jgi:hypothetical protein